MTNQHLEAAADAASALEPIDLTRETVVAYWCRILNVSPAQLRDAVQHAGHRPEDVQRYVREHGIVAE